MSVGLANEWYLLVVVESVRGGVEQAPRVAWFGAREVSGAGREA